jgi:hypothetical protein
VAHQPWVDPNLKPVKSAMYFESMIPDRVYNPAIRLFDL